ncbi:GntR family transcriptional regulator [Anaerostipes sp. MSJ-23]|uniref:GntR family transcriptional regulator n=1 Tax=unclassified Anaerostipes TaxID=2635253 RepID=UPI001C110048|nr:GntR family transcriptional regulator [Anaerostipes sp. MSJ-23]MBU5460000.1 GntR family transcriptional regulator [Anaerostipes sp. MSJ-23]
MKIIISNRKGQPIYEQIYEQIKNLIIMGELEADQMLPSIRGLAKDLRISVITTKRAYDELEKDGFINSVAGKGSFVARKNTELIREENLKKIEQYLEKALQLSKTCGLTRDDLIEMITIMGKDEL